MLKMDYIILCFSWLLLKPVIANFFIPNNFNLTSSSSEDFLLGNWTNKAEILSTIANVKNLNKVQSCPPHGGSNFWKSFNSTQDLETYIHKSYPANKSPGFMITECINGSVLEIYIYPVENTKLNNSYHNYPPTYYTFTTSNDDHRLRNSLMLIGYVLIIFISLGGNCLVCHVIYSTPRLRTTTNLLIFSLTGSDILTTVLNIPFNCLRIMKNEWPFPDFFCILLPTIQVTTVYVSTLTMTAIGVHRYRSVRLPRITKPLCRLSSSLECARYGTPKAMIIMLICLIWIISILLSLPHSIFNKVIESQFGSLVVRRCVAMYPSSVEDRMPLWLSIEVTLTQFIVPLTITVILYYKIAKIIQRQGQIAQHFSDEMNRRICENKRKRIVMLILVVATFTFSWFPLTLYHMLNDLHIVPFDYNIFLFLHLIAMSSVCYNPLIYCGMSEDFRLRVKQILCSSPLKGFLDTFRKRSSIQASLTSLSNGGTYAVSSEAGGLRESGQMNSSVQLDTAITILTSSNSSSTIANSRNSAPNSKTTLISDL